MPPESFFDEFIDKDFDTQYVPKSFERIAKQFLLRQNLRGQINPVLYAIGTYYYNDPIKKKNGEFDVVTLNKNGYDFYEVKFTSAPINDSVIREEILQLNSAPIEYNRMGFFSKSGFNICSSDNLILYSLDDLYS